MGRGGDVVKRVGGNVVKWGGGGGGGNGERGVL